MSLIELVKSEVFKKPILDALEMKVSNGYVNLQDDKPTTVLSPMTKLLVTIPHHFMSH